MTRLDDVLRSIDIDVAGNAAELRARHNIRLPDALQVAVALQSGCDAFITNDKQLLRVDEMAILVLDDFVGSTSMQ